MTTVAPAFDEDFRIRLSGLFRWRRDVRRFRPDALPPGMLQVLLDEASLAPSVGLSQPWRFVTVDDPLRRAAVRGSFAASNADAHAGLEQSRAAQYARLKLAGLDDAPCQLAVFSVSDPEQGHGLGRRTMPETTLYSTVMAVHTLWLAARAHGIGVGWVSILDPETVAAALEVPQDWQLVAYLCIGWPEADSDVPELERAGWEQRRDTAAAVLRR
jgi:5,6-dimethylbenzimidazole synthase